jgi:hypothetical protein
MPTVEIYFQKGCGACDIEIPRIVREAKSLGLDVRTYDIDTCPVNKQEACGRIEVVPTLMYQGREISLGDLKEIARSS